MFQKQKQKQKGNPFGGDEAQDGLEALKGPHAELLKKAKKLGEEQAQEQKPQKQNRCGCW